MPGKSGVDISRIITQGDTEKINHCIQTEYPVFWIKYVLGVEGDSRSEEWAEDCVRI